MSQASDFLDAISLGNFQTNSELRYGHGRKYYSKNSGFSEVEIFTFRQQQVLLRLMFII